jgi:hypothetical protein
MDLASFLKYVIAIVIEVATVVAFPSEHLFGTAAL